MKVLIAISARPDQGRWIENYQSIHDLDKPEGTKVQFFTSWFSYQNKKHAVAKAIKEGFTRIFFVDDDQILPPDTLTRLLAHDLDVVTCNLISRVPPFHPFLFDSAKENGEAHCLTLDEQKGLIEVAACGAGGILFKTRVFESGVNWGIDEVIRTEDLYICRELKKFGFRIYCDLNAPSGHICVATVWPNKKDGKWITNVVMNNDLRIDLPAASFNADGNLSIKVNG